MPIIPALSRQRQGDYCEFEDSLDYLVSSRLVLVTRIKHFFSNKEKQIKTKNRGNFFLWPVHLEVT